MKQNVLPKGGIVSMFMELYHRHTKRWVEECMAYSAWCTTIY